MNAPLVPWLGHLFRDLRFAGRTLRKQPGFTAVAILTLALGVGVNSAMFSVANPVLFRPFPYRDAGRLVALVSAKRDQPTRSTHVSYATLRDWRRATRSFDALAGYTTAGSTLTGSGEASELVTTAVTGTLFEVLGSQARIGRTLSPEDDVPGAARVIVIGDQFWRRMLNGRPDVLGHRLTLDGTVYTIVGVMGPDFTFPHTTPPSDVWMPLNESEPFGPLLAVRAAQFLDVIGRLRPGTDRSRAQAEISILDATLARTYPATDRDTVTTVVDFQQAVLGDTRPALLLLMGAVGLLLLIACTNVANLHLARTSSRARELAIRSALGASRRRLIEQVILESLVLAVPGGGLGLLVAAGGLEVLRALIGQDVPLVRGIGIDRWVLGFTFGVSCLTGLVFGAIPALVSTGSDLQDQFKSGGRSATPDRRRSRAQGALVVSEIALALVMLTCASLLVRSLERLHQVRAGFDATGAWTATITLPRTEYPLPAAWQTFCKELTSRIESLPGVESVGYGVGVPLTGPAIAVPFSVAGSSVPSGERTTADLVEAGPTYFRSLRIAVVRGRTFEDFDTDRSPAVGIVNQTLVRRFLDGRNPVGRHLSIGSQGSSIEIVGVVADTLQSSVTAVPPPVLYLAFAQRPFWVVSFVVRTKGASVDVAHAFEHEVATLAPDAPIVGAGPMPELLERDLAPSSHRSLVLGLLSGLALALAGIGIYGMLAYTVARRTQEVGVRIALGAEPLSVLGLVLGQSLRLAAVGIALGVVLSRAAVPILSTLLFRVSPTDPLTLVGVPTLLVLVALAACYVPARRATRVDPVVALRSE